MSHPSRSRIDDARCHAAQLEREGWTRVHPGTFARMRAGGQEQHYDFRSRLTGEILDADGRVEDLAWDLWFRRGRDAPPCIDVNPTDLIRGQTR